MTLRPLILLLALLACGHADPPPRATLIASASLFGDWRDLEGARATQLRGGDARNWYAGKFVELDRGETCEVLNSHCGEPFSAPMAEVQVAVGAHRGERGWLASKFLSPDPCTQSPPR